MFIAFHALPESEKTTILEAFIKNAPDVIRKTLDKEYPKSGVNACESKFFKGLFTGFLQGVDEVNK